MPSQTARLARPAQKVGIYLLLAGLFFLPAFHVVRMVEMRLSFFEAAEIFVSAILVSLAGTLCALYVSTALVGRSPLWRPADFAEVGVAFWFAAVQACPSSISVPPTGTGDQRTRTPPLA